MKQLAGDYGFRHVPCHAFDPDATLHEPKAPATRAYRAARRGAPTDRLQWSRAHTDAYAGRISELLDRGSTTDDIAALFAEDGLALEPKGKGWVVGHAQSYVKLSALGLQLTANGLTKRRPPATKRRKRASPSSNRPANRFRRNIWTVDAIDIARAIGSKDDVRAAVQDARGQRKARIAKAPLMQQLMEELKEQLRASTSLSPPARPSAQKRRSTRRARLRHTRQDR